MLAAEGISHPALLLLRSPLLAPHLTGGFVSDFASTFPHSLDMLTCPWGPLLRGGSKADPFTRLHQHAIDVIEFDPDVPIESIEDLHGKHFTVPARRPY
jgi:hypothetical protein